jgi:hypothetical protein
VITANSVQAEDRNPRFFNARLPDIEASHLVGIVVGCH